MTAAKESYQDAPVVIVEVLSKSTHNMDRREKKIAYLGIPSVRCYLLVEQEFAKVDVYRRSNSDFDHEIYNGLNSVIPLSEIGVELSLSDIYERVEFQPE